MADVSVFEGIFNEYNENPEPVEETFDEIKKNLLRDFETATTVINTGKVCGEREPVKVYLRVRPLTNKEITAGESQGCLEIVNSSSVLMHPPKTSFTFKHQSRNTISAETVHRFSFSRVFGPDTSQKSFFEDTSFNVVKDFIDGQNCLVFSYGVTNAGKTYTILGNGKNVGVLPRTINILFNSFKEQNYVRSNLKPRMFCDVVKLSSLQEEREESKKKMLLSLIDVPTYHNSVSSTDLSLQDMSEQSSIKDLSSILDATSVDVDFQGPIQFSVWISFAEIYNENIYDLLEPISLGKNKKRTVLKVGDDRKGNPYIKGLTEIHVNNAEEALQLLKIGRKNQKIASTKLNENSSRSHCIFTLKILRVVNTKEPHVARVSRLSFVDLAGSERYTKTQNTGERLKEAGNINTSIMTLGKCVALLRYNQNHVNNPKNIPFRESKLTRLFQGFFCGKGKASMIVNVNQCASAFDETLHALKFSAIAKKVTTMVQAPQVETCDPPVLPRSTRSSVAWADGSLSTPAGNKAQTELDDTQLAPLAEEEKTDIQEHTCQELQAVIDVLQAQLIEEKKNMVLIEVKIREEVCQEMSEQMVEIENDYNERLLESQRMNEDLYEQRMDLLTKSVKKSRKRPRVDCAVQDDDDDDKWVSSLLLHQEKMKVQELISKIDDLEQKMKEMEGHESKENESFKKELRERDEKIECLQRIVKDCKVELETKTTQLMSAKKVQGGRCATPTKTTGSLLKQLETRLEETTIALDKKNSQVIDKNNIIARLENSLKDAKEDLQEREEALSELRVKHLLLTNENKDEIDNEREIKQLKVQLQEKESALMAKTKENEEVLENLQFVEGEMEILTSKDENQDELLVKLRQREDELKKQVDEYEQLKLNLEKQLEENENVLKDAKTEAEELKNSNELKEQELLGREVKIKELTEIADGLKADFDKALVNLANVQATVQLRNQRLEHLESQDTSLKDACRGKECEIMQLRKDLDNARKELQDNEKHLSQLKDEMEKRIREETLKVNVNWESATERMKIGLEEQEDVLAQMEKNLAMKENEISDLRQKTENLNKILEEKNASEEALSNWKENLEDQIERLKIKVFELETEVVKLQKEVKKQTTKKDSAMQALRDGLEIVKTKKLEYETKMESIMKEKEDMKRIHDELKKEVERLKSASSESSDEKSALENDCTSSDVDNVYKPTEVESFNLPTNDRVEIDVTPITGSGLIKGGKKTGSAKAKSLKRNSSDLSLKEIKELNAKSRKVNNDLMSEDDFTPVSVTKLRKTRSSSVSKANMLPSPSSFSLSVLIEDSENTNPLVARNSQKSTTSGKRRFFNKFGISENGKSQTASKDPVLSTLPAKKRRVKLLKKNEISAPFAQSPLSQMDKMETPTPASRAQELITRHLRSRVVKSAR